MINNKTIGELMKEMRVRAGANEYKGHEYMGLNRFADDTKHMIIFDVISEDCNWGERGDRMRLFLNEGGYSKALAFEKDGQIKIKSHAKVKEGNLCYDSKEQIR